jgi:hypothetical protein
MPQRRSRSDLVWYVVQFGNGTGSVRFVAPDAVWLELSLGLGERE